MSFPNSFNTTPFSFYSFPTPSVTPPKEHPLFALPLNTYTWLNTFLRFAANTDCLKNSLNYDVTTLNMTPDQRTSLKHFNEILSNIVALIQDPLHSPFIKHDPNQKVMLDKATDLARLWIIDIITGINMMAPNASLQWDSLTFISIMQKLFPPVGSSSFALNRLYSTPFGKYDLNSLRIEGEPESLFIQLDRPLIFNDMFPSEDCRFIYGTDSDVSTNGFFFFKNKFDKNVGYELECAILDKTPNGLGNTFLERRKREGGGHEYYWFDIDKEYRIDDLREIYSFLNNNAVCLYLKKFQVQQGTYRDEESVSPMPMVTKTKSVAAAVVKQPLVNKSSREERKPAAKPTNLTPKVTASVAQPTRKQTGLSADYELIKNFLSEIEQRHEQRMKADRKLDPKTEEDINQWMKENPEIVEDMKAQWMKEKAEIIKQATVDAVAARPFITSTGKLIVPQTVKEEKSNKTPEPITITEIKMRDKVEEEQKAKEFVDGRRAIIPASSISSEKMEVRDKDLNTALQLFRKKYGSNYPPKLTMESGIWVVRG